MAVTVRVVAPARFDDDFKGVAASGEKEVEPHNVFLDSLDAALWVRLAASLGAAAIVFSTLVARRIVRPVRQVHDAARRLANGHYDERVTEPGELELAEFAARDVNRLAVELETTERRRRAAHLGGRSRDAHPADDDRRVRGRHAGRCVRAERGGAGRGGGGDIPGCSGSRRTSPRFRAEEGATELHLRVVDLGELAASSAERLRPQFDEKGVSLSVAARPPLPVEVDPDRIAQVLTNLFGNALTYTAAGGRVDVRASRERDVANITVSDTGIGLSPEDRELIFDRFYQVRGPTTRPSGGSGIGLTIARGLARAHHGDMQVASPGVGAGSVFTLALPMARRERPESS